METWMIVALAGAPLLIASAFAWEGLRKRGSKEPSEQPFLVDIPSGAVSDTQRRGGQPRGRPVDNFNQKAGEISVNQPRFGENYREPRDAVLAIQRGGAQTEDSEGARDSYMARFEELLETNSQLKLK